MVRIFLPFQMPLIQYRKEVVAIIDAARFVLPELSFIGGESQEPVFRLFTHTKEPLDASNIQCEMSIIPYGNFTIEPIVCKIGTTIKGEEEISYIKVVLNSTDTVGLSGKFIYQISLKDGLGNVDIFQGMMTIFNNSNRDFVLQTRF